MPLSKSKNLPVEKSKDLPAASKTAPPASTKSTHQVNIVNFQSTIKYRIGHYFFHFTKLMP
jgi:hypothetical protein